MKLLSSSIITHFGTLPTITWVDLMLKQTVNPFEIMLECQHRDYFAGVP